MPLLILVLLSATGGAAAAVGGAMLIVGALDLTDFTSGATTQRLADDWWWYAIYARLAVAGILVQLGLLDRTARTVRDSWEGTGRHELTAGPTPSGSSV